MDVSLQAACDRFEAAFAKWLTARAELASPHEYESDEVERQRTDRERRAQLALIATPAPHSTALWRKWELLDHVLSAEQDAGQDAYPVAIVLVASLKADIFALGLKPWPGG